jgi:hypothetical protein
MIFKHINEPPPPIAAIPPAVQSVIDRALAKKPEDRYQTARALAADYMDAIGMNAEASTLRMSLPAGHGLPSITAPRSGQATVAPPRNRTAILAVVGVVILALTAFAVTRFLGASNRPTQGLEPLEQPTEIHATVLPGAVTDVVPVAAAETVGLLRFQDGTGPADTITISTSSMPPPPAGSQYELWLIQDDGEQRISIGNLAFDQENRGSRNYVDAQGRNLLGLYSALEITVEPDPDSNPNSSNDVAFFVRLPESGLIHVRHLIYSFDATPNQVGFVRGLDASTSLLANHAGQMLSALEAGDEAEMLLQTENMLSLIVGNQSPDYRDWNGNGTIDDPGDGYGLLLNGDHAGYIQGTYTHADLALTSPDATENMLTHGEHVKASANNVSNWTAELRTQLIAVFENQSSPDREATIRQAVALANQIRTGLDINGNENIEPIPGEGGAVTAYEHAYYMADMLILPTENQTP